VSVRWTPAHTAEELERRYREALHLPTTAHFPVADPDPLTGEQNPSGWREFAAETLGFVPAQGVVEQRLWQDFLARRYHRIGALNDVYGAGYAQFSDVSMPLRLPLTATELHRFTVMLPMPASLTADSAEQRRRLAIARRIVELEKPAHTTFDVKFYWALFRVGDARLGEDTQIGLGSRAPELMPPAILDETHLAETYLAPSPPLDSKSRTFAQCRVLSQTASWQGEDL
jgi:hypothetical protein